MCGFPQLLLISCGPEIMPINTVHNVIGYIFAEVWFYHFSYSEFLVPSLIISGMCSKSNLAMAALLKKEPLRNIVKLYRHNFLLRIGCACIMMT